MSYVIHITRQGIAVFDGMHVVNGGNAEAVFQAIRGMADNVAPIIDGALETSTFAELLRDVSAADVSATTRDFTASALGILAGLAALPLGPTASFVADQAFSSAFTKAYDAANTWSQNQDWGKFYDFWNPASSPNDNAGNDPFTGMPWPGMPWSGNPTSPGNPGSPTGTGGTIAPSTGSCFAGAKNWVPPRRDPLVLDLDGNGISTSGINPAAPIYFDQDGDGTLTATGWIGAGEAIVVRDLNGNGLIDSGRELFGDNTILTRGPNAGHPAANGFAALADLDLDANGRSDGKFDSNGAAYSSVRLWKDSNQDGISPEAFERASV